MSELEHTQQAPAPAGPDVHAATPDCCAPAASKTEEKGERKRFLKGGFWSGVVGGICCAGGALLVAIGVIGAAAFTGFMNRYQPFFLIASFIAMGGWLYWMSRKVGFEKARIMLVKHGAIMGAIYLLTIVISMAAASLVGAR